jgi:hypothetical protein
MRIRGEFGKKLSTHFVCLYCGMGKYHHVGVNDFCEAGFGVFSMKFFSFSLGETGHG